MVATSLHDSKGSDRLSFLHEATRQERQHCPKQLRRGDGPVIALRQLPQLSNVMTCISSTLDDTVAGLSNARARARARVVETLEQSLPLALGALALGEAVQNHTSHQILNFTARARDHISLHRLSSSVQFSRVNLHFLILRGSRAEQCRISAVCNPAGSELQKSTWIELLWPSEAFPKRPVANSFVL